MSVPLSRCHMPTSAFIASHYILGKIELFSLDFIVNRFFMKLFKTNNIDVVKSFADSATPDVTVSEDVPMLHEVTRAIRRLKNGRAAGADGITAELLKGAEKPTSKALHKVITNVWSTGRVPAE